MKCPFCGASETTVADTRINDDGDIVRRRRRCLTCDKIVQVYEPSCCWFFCFQYKNNHIFHKKWSFASSWLSNPFPIHILRTMHLIITFINFISFPNFIGMCNFPILIQIIIEFSFSLYIFGGTIPKLRSCNQHCLIVVSVLIVFIVESKSK